MNYNFYQPMQNDTIFAYVNGIDGARNYQIPSNRSAILMDSEKDMFYLKTINQLGQANIKCYQFKEVGEPKPTTYATKEEIDAISEKINALLKMVEDKK